MIKARISRLTCTEKEAEQQVLTDAEIKEMTKLGLKIEKHYGSPQDTEWAIEGSKVYMVQSRPITTLIKSAVAADGQSTRKKKARS